MNTETASLAQRAYPREWGTPAGSPYSTERTAWVVQHIAERSRTTTATTGSSNTSGTRARASLHARHDGPMTPREARVALLERRRRTAEQDERAIELAGQSVCP